MKIYKITNKINGKIYIGKESKYSPEYFGSGIYIRRAIKKHGKNNFTKEILETCSSLKELNKREKYWIKKLNSANREIGYNLTDGGDGGDTWRLSNKRKELIKRLENGRKQFAESPEGKKIFSELMKKRWEDSVFRNKMSKLLKERKITWKEKISKSVKAGWKNNPHPPISEKTRKKLSNAAKGKQLKTIDSEHEKLILELYKDNGPKGISLELEKNKIYYSPYIIIKFLIKHKVYKKYAKGISKNKT